jgi:hypothetical protein
MLKAILPEEFGAGVKVEVAIGDGEDAGKLRISTEGDCNFTLGKSALTNKFLLLRLPKPAYVNDGKRQAGVVFRDDGSALYIELPKSWLKQEGDSLPR